MKRRKVNTVPKQSLRRFMVGKITGPASSDIGKTMAVHTFNKPTVISEIKANCLFTSGDTTNASYESLITLAIERDGFFIKNESMWDMSSNDWKLLDYYANKDYIDVKLAIIGSSTTVDQPLKLQLKSDWEWQINEGDKLHLIADNGAGNNENYQCFCVMEWLEE